MNNKIEIYCDGSFHETLNHISDTGIYCCVIFKNNILFKEKSHASSKFNNNIECEIMSINLAISLISSYKLNINNIIIYNDCQSIINLINNNKYNKFIKLIKNKENFLKTLYGIIKNYQRNYDLQIKWIPRSLNKNADKLTKEKYNQHFSCSNDMIISQLKNIQNNIVRNYKTSKNKNMKIILNNISNSINLLERDYHI